MNFEEYVRRIAAINETLQAIADLTKNQALTGCANQDNPMFVAAMREHERLTTLSDELTTQAKRAVGLE